MTRRRSNPNRRPGDGTLPFGASTAPCVRDAAPLAASVGKLLAAKCDSENKNRERKKEAASSAPVFENSPGPCLDCIWVKALIEYVANATVFHNYCESRHPHIVILLATVNLCIN